MYYENEKFTLDSKQKFEDNA